MNIFAENVEITLGDSQILNRIGIDVRSREFVGVIGPNGSGKSTFLKCIYRVLQPSGGTILLDGTPLHGLPVRETAKKVAVLSQHNYYNFEFTVRDIVLMGRSPHKRMMERDTKADYDIVRQSLEKVGMGAYEDRIFSTLSGGEQQRIILARALAQQTECLILDEPTNHLDIKYQLQILDVVKQLNVTVLAAFHDLNIAAMYCDRIYAIEAGRAVACGTPEQVLTPELIRRLYEVDADVRREPDGQIHIVYHPMKRSVNS
ncbi:MAG: ABC transporter ATP-binding protein [Clostridia bacterium]|nr:ABC transporter ATP-binding protein [Clostridia bacterium]